MFFEENIAKMRAMAEKEKEFTEQTAAEKLAIALTQFDPNLHDVLVSSNQLAAFGLTARDVIGKLITTFDEILSDQSGNMSDRFKAAIDRLQAVEACYFSPNSQTKNSSKKVVEGLRSITLGILGNTGNEGSPERLAYKQYDSLRDIIIAVAPESESAKRIVAHREFDRRVADNKGISNTYKDSEFSIRIINALTLAGVTFEKLQTMSEEELDALIDQKRIGVGIIETLKAYINRERARRTDPSDATSGADAQS